jgi:hypothetical protein
VLNEGFRLRLFVAAVLLLVPDLATAQVYKCTDKDGRVKYTQTRPKGTECTENAPKAPSPLGTGSAEPYKDIGTQADQRQAADARARETAAQQQAAKDARCAQWRARLAALERASHVFRTDEKGEREYNTAQQNDALREEARNGVAAECS